MRTKRTMRLEEDDEDKDMVYDGGLLLIASRCHCSALFCFGSVSTMIVRLKFTLCADDISSICLLHLQCDCIAKLSSKLLLVDLQIERREGTS